jgi:hypothetical protein
MALNDSVNEMQFSDPDFLGSPEFSQKYQQHKDQKMQRAGGRPNPMAAQQAMMNIIQLEAPHKERLTQLAVQTVKDMFPVIEDAGIQIEAQIVPMGQIHVASRPTPEPIRPENPLYKKAAKRKIMNAITQAAGVSMNSAHHAVDALSQVNPQLKDMYDTVYKNNDALYHAFDKNQLIQMANQMNQQGYAGGSTKVEYRNGQPVIIAKAINSMHLMHEIIKGVYEYLSHNAHDDEDEFKQISRHTDSIADEIDDIVNGEVIRDTIRNYLIDNHDDLYQHPSFFEMFLVLLARTEENEMVRLVDGLIKGLPNRRRLEQLARDTFHTLRDFERNKATGEND